MNQLFYSVNSAKTDFCKLATLAAAGGCEVVITRHRKPIAKLVGLDVAQPKGSEERAMNTKEQADINQESK